MLKVNKIYCGDCLGVMRKMPDKSIDMVVTDPPYGINYLSRLSLSRTNKAGIRTPYDSVVAKRLRDENRIKNDGKFVFPFDEMRRLIKDTGAIFFFYSWRKEPRNIPIKNKIIWVKNGWGAGDLSGDFANQYESIAFCPIDNSRNGFKIRGKRLSNVWHFNRVSSRGMSHPTEKPVELMKRIIECGSDRGDLILDPFLGTGATAVAAKLLGRRFIGIELESKYCKIANERLGNIDWERDRFNSKVNWVKLL